MGNLKGKPLNQKVKPYIRCLWFYSDILSSSLSNSSLNMRHWTREQDDAVFVSSFEDCLLKIFATDGGRAFSFQALLVRNQPPDCIRETITLSILKIRLKTLPFGKAYN